MTSVVARQHETILVMFTLASGAHGQTHGGHQHSQESPPHHGKVEEAAGMPTHIIKGLSICP